ncbi:MAG: DUF1501 domain-containing protein [Verrucomicrobiales bacterium]|nr:DUF1501 domain-containing protein [Verrucomicrobiales bacterium]
MRNPLLLAINRRAFLGRSGLGLMALASLLHPNIPRGAAAAGLRWTGAINPSHQPQRAKRVIFLYMSGGPSHLETFDNKPQLARLHGQPMPESFTKGQQIAQLQDQELACLAPQFAFSRHGNSGQEISELFPHIGAVADNICIIRSMVTDAINHDPAHTLMNTGTVISGRPSMGSWVLYGLGAETEELPGFVVLTSTEGRSPQPIATRLWHSGFLPGQFQGVHLRSKGDPVLYLNRPRGVSAAQQHEVVSAVQALNRSHQTVIDDPEIATRIAQYEMAFRMQSSVPALMDVSNEPNYVHDLYGCRPGDGSFASNCLLARRLAERGVRFIQLYHRDWDHHNDLVKFIRQNAAHVDRATAALIKDLKERGMLDDTLIIWGGEFGRTPMAQKDKGGPGRDHHMRGFSMFLCGGGIKPGFTYGSTDELGYNAVEDVVHVHDLHATILHLLGIDHKRLTVKFQGLDIRLTNVAGNVVSALLA